MDFENLKNIIDYSLYRSTLQAVVEEASVGMKDFMNSTILNIALDDIKCSSLKEDDFYHHLEKNNEDLIAFSVTRINGFKDSKTEQEYAEGEDQEDDEILEQGGLAVTSLISFIIEFHYLLNNDDKGLTQYLKKIRLPQAAQHKADIKRFFKQFPGNYQR